MLKYTIYRLFEIFISAFGVFWSIFLGLGLGLGRAYYGGLGLGITHGLGLGLDSDSVKKMDSVEPYYKLKKLHDSQRIH